LRFTQLRRGRLGRESVGEISLGPGPAPCLHPWYLVVLVVAVLVSFGEGPGDVGGSDDHDAVGFAGGDSVGGECFGKVLEGPVVIFGRIQIGEPAQHDLSADAWLSPQDGVDVSEMVGCWLLFVVGFGGGYGEAVFGEEGHGAGDDGGDVVAVFVEWDVEGVDEFESVGG
jgi:hypothetical protein